MQAFAFSGTTVYYGYDAALARSQKSTTQHLNTQFQTKEQAAVASGVAVHMSSPFSATEQDPEYFKGHVEVQDREPSHVGDEGLNRVTDLVLIVHGIGQGVCNILPSIPLFMLFCCSLLLNTKAGLFCML
jgi:hypothetical protein